MIVGINAVKKRRDKGFVEFSKQSHRLDEERNRQELLQVQGEGSNTLYNDEELLLEESKTNKNAYKNGMIHSLLSHSHIYHIIM